ncbi:hemicentin-1-like isoform X1 [Macrobrachium nipponense]|uniref:hemicentin-1-like isoform X1 n=1 Tax=Macrobrachium nipponense TaxID=159736 RepID=UPI0030C83D32
MSRNILIALCLVAAGVAVTLGSPAGPKDVKEEENQEGKQPKITYSKETVAKAGAEVKIDCSVEGVDLSGVDGFGVSWSKIDEDKPTNSFPISANEKVLLFTDRFSVEHPDGSYQYSLIIKQLQEDDTGLYRCTVNFGEEQKINADVPVKIERSPYFTDNFTKTLTVTEGDAISIDCQPGGSPKPDVFWERLNQELPYYGGKFFKANQFDIPHIERDHEGHYVCYADNGIGDPATSHIILEVQFPPQVKVDREQIFVNPNDQATLTCSVEAHPTADATWYKDGIVILGDANTKVTKVDIKGNDEKRPIGVNSTLAIGEVGEDDLGTYTCKSVNTIGKTERTVELRRKSPPKIISQSRSEVLYDLERTKLRDALPVVIECEAEGDPSPSFRWNKNGEPLIWQADPRIDLEPGTGNLLISDPTLDDNGLYQCFAYNELGTALGDPVLLVNSSSIQFSNAADNKDSYEVEAELGRPFKLSCPNATAYPEPSLNWVKAVTREDQIEIIFISEERIVADPQGNLWFTHVTPEDATEGNSFQYMCLGSTVFQPTDYSIASIINLKVKPPADGGLNGEEESLNVESFSMYTSPSEVTFKALEENTLWCIYGGEPAPTVNWRRTDGVEIDKERFVTRNFGRTLVFNNTQLSDMGEYECAASNGVGETKTSTMTVIVEQAPTFVGDMASQTVKEGSIVTFTCEVEATGEVTFHWLFNGRPLSSEGNHPRRSITDNVLRIEDVSLVDIGNYACNATSEIGYAYGQATLNVLPGVHRVTSSGEVTKLREEVNSLRDIVQKMHDLIERQLEVSNHNHEKLHEISTLLEATGVVKPVSIDQDEVTETSPATTEEPVVVEGIEETTENIFAS